MLIRRSVLLSLAAGAAFTLLPVAHAEGFRHEFNVKLVEYDFTGSSSGHGQSLDYSFFLKPVQADDVPYAEEAFVARAASVTAKILGGEVVTNGSSANRTEATLQGRYVLPESPYFAEASYSRLAAWVNPSVLSNASSESVTKVMRAAAGMYVSELAALDVSLAKSSTVNDPIEDATAVALGVHGKALLSVGADRHVLLDLALTRTAAEYDEETETSINYDAKATWFFTRAMSVALGLGSGIDFAYPLADYRTFDLSGTWFVQPEVVMAFDFRQLTWDNDSEERYFTLRFGLRL